MPRRRGGAPQHQATLELPGTQGGETCGTNLGVGMGGVCGDEILHLAQDVGFIGVAIGIEKEVVRQKGAAQRVVVLGGVDVLDPFHLPVAGTEQCLAAK
jgi:hypothetical protein